MWASFDILIYLWKIMLVRELFVNDRCSAMLIDLLVIASGRIFEMNK